MPISSSYTENIESFSCKKWIAAFLLATTISALALLYQYDRERQPHRSPVTLSLQGKLIPLTSEKIVTKLGLNQSTYYRIINPIEPYNEIYILSESGKEEIDDKVVYAKEKISCPDMVKIVGRQVDTEVNSGVVGSEESAAQGETQILADTWECMK